jgi:hypothetical protein
LKGATAVRSDDTASLKVSIPEYLLLNVKDVLSPPMLSKAKVKNDRGFYHPITAALLCPVKYPKTPQFVFIFYSCVASYSNFN